MISIKQTKTTHNLIELTDDEALSITIQYLRGVVMGDGCYINEKGRLTHWTKYPHGSGTTTDKGIPTPLQEAASKILRLL